MHEIEVDELARWRDEGREIVILDVREPFELQLAPFPDALHIPMRQIPERVSEIDTGKTVAVLCHHGDRSAMVAQFLQHRGFEQVYNVSGGIDAFASRVDATIPRY